MPRVLQKVSLEKGATEKDAKGNRISLRNQIKKAFPQKDYISASWRFLPQTPFLWI
jgi:hypothetical protein